VPNVGWCETQFNQEHILGDLNGDYYFTHSYYPVLRDQRSVFSTSLHGNNPITSGVVSDGIVGLQFHPEKSGEVGNKLLSSLLHGLASNRKPISL
jgi:glutamine amidotransferase